MICPADMMAVSLSRLIKDGDRVFHGVSSHLPMVALQLARQLHAPHAVHLCIPGGVDPVTRRAGLVSSAGDALWQSAAASFDLADVFDLSMRGGLDVAFLSGVQFDHRGGVNASLIGTPDQVKIRLPGGAGSAVLVPTAKRVILWRSKHDRRTFVNKLDFLTARGHVTDIVTPLCHFQMFEGELVLKALHPGVTMDQVAFYTGFPLRYVSVDTTPLPSAAEMAALRQVDPEGLRYIEFPPLS